MEEVQEKQKALEMTEEQIAEERKEHMATIDFKMVTFSLSGKDYAIDIMSVKEIAKAGRFTYVPNTAPYVLGVYNLRGDIIPIIDLRLFFNIDVEERTDNEIENMIIVTVDDKAFGIVVDGIDKVVGIQSSTIQPPHPLFGDINIKYIYGVVESNNRLYILLDIEKIFTNRSKETDAPVVKYTAPKKGVDNLPVEESKVSKTEKKVVESIKENSNEKDIDFNFVAESLKNFKKFIVSNLNNQWVKARFQSWIKERGVENTQLADEKDADLFLSTFYSSNSGKFWSEDYAKKIFKILPENTAKQIIVWNPGCGKGFESYSLACILKKKYPEARIRIYAHDLDLLNVSNASLLTIPNDVANTWYSPYVTKNVSGSFVFSPEIKEMIMFEYHDCTNTNTVPNADIIFCRDLLSFMNEDIQNNVLQDFEEKLKGNGILVLGENEALSGNSVWTEKKIDNIFIYTK